MVRTGGALAIAWALWRSTAVDTVATGGHSVDGWGGSTRVHRHSEREHRPLHSGSPSNNTNRRHRPGTSWSVGGRLACMLRAWWALPSAAARPFPHSHPRTIPPGPATFLSAALITGGHA
ncbi:hypothetical protein AAG570_012258 [Ranatra chinensis]|uniref:Secreted protein n=1 Tax=Ranatra chinensis TaxID=642074 RepID=A0ABD0YIH8_9HEMI